MILRIHQAFQFVDVGKAPVGKSGKLASVKLHHHLKGLFPGDPPRGEIRQTGPEKTGQTVKDRFSTEFKSGLWPGQPGTDLTVLSGPRAGHRVPQSVVAGVLSGGGKTEPSAHRPNHSFVLFVTVKHASSPEMYIPGITGVDDGRGGGPIPAMKEVFKGVPRGKNRIFGLIKD
nr:hypothetical protein [Thermosulfurimonas marina]